MAFKLAKQDHAARSALIDKLNAAAQDIEDAVNTYNEVLEEARGFRDELVSRWSDEIGDKSEKWQESDRGVAAQDFVEEWNGLDLDDIDPPEIEHASALEGASEEAA